MTNHPKVGIGVLIYQNQSILLGKRLSDHGAYTWGPPGGHLEFGETFEECAIRETREETGLILTNPKLTALTNDVFRAENKHYVSVFLSAAFPENQAVKNLEQEKILSWEWFNINILPDCLFLPLRNLLQAKGKDYLSDLVRARL